MCVANLSSGLPTIGSIRLAGLPTVGTENLSSGLPTVGTAAIGMPTGGFGF